MNRDVKDLIILQDRDNKLSIAMSVISGIPNEVKRIKSEFNNAQKSLLEAKELYQNTQKKIHAVAMKRKTHHDTILKLKSRQGETRKNEEYAMLEHEILRYKKFVDDFESEEISLLEELDIHNFSKAQADERFLIEKELITKRSKDLIEKKANIEKEVQLLKSQVTEAKTVVSSNLLDLYNRIKKARGVTKGVIVTITVSGKCSGCNIKLQPSLIHQVHSQLDVVQCNECSRILYNA